MVLCIKRDMNDRYVVRYVMLSCISLCVMALVCAAYSNVDMMMIAIMIMGRYDILLLLL